jgi:hypothetical protein
MKPQRNTGPGCTGHGGRRRGFQGRGRGTIHRMRAVNLSLSPKSAQLTRKLIEAVATAIG